MRNHFEFKKTIEFQKLRHFQHEKVLNTLLFIKGRVRKRYVFVQYDS